MFLNHKRSSNGDQQLVSKVPIHKKFLYVYTSSPCTNRLCSRRMKQGPDYPSSTHAQSCTPHRLWEAAWRRIVNNLIAQFKQLHCSAMPLWPMCRHTLSFTKDAFALVYLENLYSIILRVLARCMDR